VILTLALRSLVSRPIRSAVLAAGFGLGVSVMAALLGIGSVILDQARAPALSGGGDVVIGGATGRIGSARYVLSSVLGTGSLADRIKVASPGLRSNMYLVDEQGVVPIVARGGIPSLERRIDDPEVRNVAAWTDSNADRAWASPDHEEVLRAMDRFHAIPDVPARQRSWAEWLYFNGRSGSTRFYLSFIAGPRLDSGKRTLGVRLQLERDGKLASYSDSIDVTAEELANAPDLTAGRNTVRLAGPEYRIHFDLRAESGGSPASGDIVIAATPGRSLPPFTMRGAGGWISGYVVPVMSGRLDGTIVIGDQRFDLTGGAGYHDHNWGFWDGVRWQWGQVEGGGLSFVYGRVYPPADAADPGRLPGFLVALGPEGPVGYATDVTIEETGVGASSAPRRIAVRGRSESIDLTFDIAIDHIESTPMRAGAAFGHGLDFLQLRGTYRVSGQAAGRRVDFTAPGSAETFRGGTGG
jgi:hypothetical protein